MNILILWLALATFVATLAGGLITLKFRKSLSYFFAFAAGSVIAVAFVHLLPESIEIGEFVGIEIKTLMLIALGSFFLFSLIEKVFATHHIHTEKGHHEHQHAHIMGPIGAGSMILHSFLDGAAIGIAFQVDIAAGIIVALAVIVHDMTDGINTVVLMLKNHQPLPKTIGFLFAGALAPTLGIILTSLAQIPETWLAYLLAFFVGEFIYIGASTLIPEMREHPSKRIILFMALGILVVILFGHLIPE